MEEQIIIQINLKFFLIFFLQFSLWLWSFTSSLVRVKIFKLVGHQKIYTLLQNLKKGNWTFNIHWYSTTEPLTPDKLKPKIWKKDNNIYRPSKSSKKSFFHKSSLIMKFYIFTRSSENIWVGWSPKIYI